MQHRFRSLALFLPALLGPAAAAGTFTEPPPGATLTTATVMSPAAVVIPALGAAVSPIEVAGLPGRVWDVNVVLNVSHDVPLGLAIKLVSPSGRDVWLSQFLPRPFLGTTLDDESPLAAVVTNGAELSVQPDQAFADLAGEDPNGTWTVQCSDFANKSGIFTWQIEIATIDFEPAERVQVASSAAGQTVAPLNVWFIPVSVPDPGFVCDVDVLVHVVHPDPGGLALTLNRVGREVILALSNGTHPQFYANALFDDDEDELARTASAGIPLGTASPVGSLAHMRGLDAQGTWLLGVINDSPTDAAVVLGWEIRVTTCDEPAPETFCTGAAPAPCPCGNEGSSDGGCRNATHAGGSRLSASTPGGAPRVGDDVVLHADDLDPFQIVLFVQGQEAANGGVGTPFGDGLLCVSGQVRRLATRYSGLGSTSYPGIFDLPLSRRGGIPPEGGTRVYQAIHRSPLVFGPCHTGLNTTNGVRITWLPQ